MCQNKRVNVDLIIVWKICKGELEKQYVAMRLPLFILLASCQRCAMVRVPDTGFGWKQGLTPLVGQIYHKINSSTH